MSIHLNTASTLDSDPYRSRKHQPVINPKSQPRSRSPPNTHPQEYEEVSERSDNNHGVYQPWPTIEIHDLGGQIR
jgi:hypothetical protein